MKKQMMWIIVGVVLVFLVSQGNFQTGNQAAADVGSATVVRSFSDTLVKAGSSFNVLYSAGGMTAGSWGLLVEDDVTNGCTPANIDIGWLSPGTSQTITMTAPNTAGTCNYLGLYTFAGETGRSILGGSSVSVCVDQCLSGQIGCSSTTEAWSCNTASVCGVKQVTSCGGGQTCVNGACSADCVSLKIGALESISLWSGSPTVTNKNDALNKVSLWAAGC